MGQFYVIVAEVGFGRVYDSSPPYEYDSLDCSRFTYAVLCALLPWVNFEPVRKILHLDYDGALGAFGNVDALVEMEAADHAVNANEHGIYYCQGWRGNSGHNFFFHRRRDGSLWCVEVTNYKASGRVERRWCRQVAESDMRARYPQLRLARLRRAA